MSKTIKTETTFTELQAKLILALLLQLKDSEAGQLDNFYNGGVEDHCNKAS
jgi:hypothetical protein